MAFQRKTSPTVETVVGQAAASLRKSLDEVKSSVATLETLQSKLEDLGLQVVSKEERIKELDVFYVEKMRAHNVEFELKVKESSLKVVEEALAQHHLVAVPKQELAGLQTDLKDLTQSFDDKLKERVSAATGAIANNLNHEKKLLEADFKAKEAENVARISSLESQNVSLTNQVVHWQRQLDEERKASIERAKAGSIGTLNVGSNETGRR